MIKPLAMTMMEVMNVPVIKVSLAMDSIALVWILLSYIVNIRSIMFMYRY